MKPRIYKSTLDNLWYLKIPDASRFYFAPTFEEIMWHWVACQLYGY